MSTVSELDHEAIDQQEIFPQRSAEGRRRGGSANSLGTGVSFACLPIIAAELLAVFQHGSVVTFADFIEMLATAAAAAPL
ncbi:MAG TPA: hypothetical protein VGM32_02200 [Rhodopila sp.]|jgi:hypothetical protein